MNHVFRWKCLTLYIPSVSDLLEVGCEKTLFLILTTYWVGGSRQVKPDILYPFSFGSMESGKRKPLVLILTTYWMGASRQVKPSFDFRIMGSRHVVPEVLFEDAKGCSCKFWSTHSPLSLGL